MLTDDDLDTLVARAAPVSDDELADVSLRAADFLARRRRRRLPRRRIAAGLAAAAALAAFVVLAVSAREGDRQGTAWAAQLVKLAKDSPLLLLDRPGWKVTRADEYDSSPTKVLEGEMTFTDPAGRNADLHWRGGDLATWQKDRAHGAPLVRQFTVMGHRAQIVRYAGSDDYAALWADDDGRVLEFRTVAPSLAAYERLLDGLRRVDVDAWLSAMPPSVIKTADRAHVVQEMLGDIDVPPGFDAKALEDGSLKDRYQLGAEVTGAVACAWIVRWDAARKRGDDAIAAAAVVAMQRSHRWKILHEMQAGGAYPDVLWQFADAMRGDGTWYGRPLLGDVRQGLGCD
jgi:hypothetical protein